MNSRPILFSAPMVRALLAGTKTQTRRIVKGLPDGITAWQGPMRRVHDGSYPDGIDWCFGSGEIDGDPLNFYVDKRMACPYGQPGDRLWVRECFSYAWGENVSSVGSGAWYWADGQPEWGDWTRPKPSIHMPRWASRLTLEITGVRVERLQAISEADAKAEGIPESPGGTFYPPGDTGAPRPQSTARSAYACLWENINGHRSWDLNPWVWVVGFKRVMA